MTSLLRLAVAGVAILALVAGTGCGSDTKSSNDYVSAVNKVQTDFANNVRKVGSSTPSGSDPSAATVTMTSLGMEVMSGPYALRRRRVRICPHQGKEVVRAID